MTGPALEEVLTAQAEVLAAEEGLEPNVLEALESGVEQAAESLVTMREAGHKIAEIKKDRGYGKSNPDSMSSKPKYTGNQVNGKKAKTRCYDCGQKQVRVAEALNTEDV